MPHRIEFTYRRKWALGRIANLINEGRQACWLDGAQRYRVTAPEEVLGECDAYVGSEQTPMRALQHALRLSDSAMDALWLLACVEIDPKATRGIEPLLAVNTTTLSLQTLQLLLGDSDHGFEVERMEATALVEIEAGRGVGMHRRAIRASDRVIELARGVMELDRVVRGVATIVEGDGGPVAESVGKVFAAKDPTVVTAIGAVGSEREAMLIRAAKRVLRVEVAKLPTDGGELSRVLRAIARESKLFAAPVLLEGIDDAGERMRGLERELIDGCDGVVMATARAACSWSTPVPVVSVEVPALSEAEREAVWKRALGDDGEVSKECARRYKISAGLIEKSAAAAVRAGTVTAESVQAAVRAQLERGIAGVATRIEVKQTWDDLVLPVDQFELLIELVARVRHRGRVMEDWGFGETVGKGTGVAALLSGPPGTGKTMIAGLVAKELGLDLYQVDLSRIVSKYIGETEKQLAALFDAAEAGHAVLLFDEADSLFGKRTAVKSSNDRYANLETNYLLQRLEAFDGVAILTSNHESAIDQAFMRRLAMHVRVPMPAVEQRAQLWKALLPTKAEVEADLDVGPLAEQFAMSGGYIKNAVLRAAFLAAHAGTAIGATHLRRAARAEYEAMGKLTFGN